jgi:hypothetical protein
MKNIQILFKRVNSVANVSGPAETKIKYDVTKTLGFEYTPPPPDSNLSVLSVQQNYALLYNSAMLCDSILGHACRYIPFTIMSDPHRKWEVLPWSKGARSMRLTHGARDAECMAAIFALIFSLVLHLSASILVTEIYVTAYS